MRMKKKPKKTPGMSESQLKFVSASLTSSMFLIISCILAYIKFSCPPSMFLNECMIYLIFVDVVIGLAATTMVIYMLKEKIRNGL